MRKRNVATWRVLAPDSVTRKRPFLRGLKRLTTSTRPHETRRVTVIRWIGSASGCEMRPRTTTFRPLGVIEVIRKRRASFSASERSLPMRAW